MAKFYTTGSVGYIYQSFNSWAAVHGSSYGSGTVSSLVGFNVNYPSSIFYISRGQMLIDLSTLGPATKITSATAYFYYDSGNGPYTGNGCLQGSTYAGTLDVFQYNKFTGNQLGNAPFVVGAWNTIPFNAEGIAWLQNYIGANCPLMIREYDHDYLNAAPSLGSRYSGWADTIGPNKIYIEITYGTYTTLPPPTTVLSPTSVLSTGAPSSVIPGPPATLLTSLAPTTVVYGGPDPLLGTTFDCNKFNEEVDLYTGRISFNFDFSKRLDTWVRLLYDYFRFELGINGDVRSDNYIEAAKFDVDLEFVITGPNSIDVYTTTGFLKQGTVQWSKIGSFDFTIDHSNEAGKAFLRYVGAVYGIRKLGKSVIIYGTEAIGMMRPHELTWEFKVISKKGVFSRDAHVGDEFIQWYIDLHGDLNEVTGNGIEKLGYKEFLSNLTNPVIMMDDRREFLYICDESKGYIYSYVDKSMSNYVKKLTGFGYDTNSDDDFSCEADYGLGEVKFKDADISWVDTYVSWYPPAPLTPTTPPPSTLIKTDIFDFGYRKEKTITSLQLSVDLDVDIQAAIEYRLTIDGEFASTPWVNLTPHGVAYISCYGIEFRFKFRTLESDTFVIDQLRIDGVVHGVSGAEYVGGYYD